MKKILIASACAITLCFTSCASKQAPATEPQTEFTPQIEAETDVNEESAEENSESDTQTEKSDIDSSSENAETENSEEATQTDELTSEDFPEPEAIEEPEIVTLEPVDEVIEEPASEETEPVENEEVPEITVVETEENATEEGTTEETSQENSESENTEDTALSTETEDISANDVVIVTKPDTDGISGGIDITDDDSDSDEENAGVEADIIPSRSVTLKKFEYLDVTYPGSGWIYMGLTDNSKDIAYFGRKLGTKDTRFSLQARAAGTKIIHFYRNDPLTGQYLDDYIEVIIQPENGSNKTHIEAPEYKLPVKKLEKQVKQIEEQSEETEAENTETEKTETVNQKVSLKTTEPVKAIPVEINKTVSVAPEKKTSQTPVTTQKAEQSIQEEQSEKSASSPDSQTLLKEAQLLYNEKEYKASLSKLNQFFELSTDNRDEALYLKGQILEEKSEVRDIKGAIDAYSTLTKNYPASKFWDSANKRIIYLKRFYLEVR